MCARAFFKTILKAGTLMLAAWGIGLSSASAATEAEIEAAISDGLAWLASQQLANGSWDDSGGYVPVSTTGLAVLKLEDRAKELGKNPFDANDYEYANNVINGLDFIFSGAISDANGVHFSDSGVYDVYSTGIAMMAVAASNQPSRVITTGVLNGQTYQAALQGMMDWAAYAQNDVGCEIGGWGYGANDTGFSDNSNSGYATLGIGFANIAPPKGFGISIPAGVLAGLDTFITNVQVVGGLYDGGSIYNPCWSSGPDWVNTLKTGNLLYQMALSGRIESNSSVQAAVGFIENYWGASAGECDGCGWLGDYQAMFAMMKGLEAYGIETLTVGDWFDQVSTYIVDNQNADGSWTHTTGESPSTTLDTAWALLTLEKVVEKIEFGIPSQCVPQGESFTPFDADDYVVIGTPPYTWIWTGEVDLSVSEDADNVFSITYPNGWTGSETIVFTATDANNKTSDDDATFTVDPVPVVGNIPDQTTPFVSFDLDSYLSGIDPSQVTWSYAGNTCLLVAIDAGNVVTVTNPGGCTDPETITFTATATACDQEVSASDAVTFTPNQPPVCTAATATPGILWSPNHKFVPISILGVTDPDDDPVTITVTSIFQDEAVNARGSGNTAPDGRGVGTSTAEVRAERVGSDNGRVYHIRFTADDGSGGTCSGEVTVGVPHDQGNGAVPVDDGALYDSTVVP
jgi:hypothetical protein